MAGNRSNFGCGAAIVASLLVFLAGCSEESREPAEGLKIEPGAYKKPHKKVQIVKHEFTLRNGKTHTDSSKVTFKAGEPFNFSLRYRADNATDGQMGVTAKLVYKRPNGRELIVWAWAKLPKEVADGVYHVKGDLKIHPRSFVPGGRYVVRVGNANGVFYETPIKFRR